jgi:hypothetical protein
MASIDACRVLHILLCTANSMAIVMVMLWHTKAGGAEPMWALVLAASCATPTTEPCGL